MTDRVGIAVYLLGAEPRFFIVSAPTPRLRTAGFGLFAPKRVLPVLPVSVGLALDFPGVTARVLLVVRGLALAFDTGSTSGLGHNVLKSYDRRGPQAVFVIAVTLSHDRKIDRRF